MKKTVNKWLLLFASIFLMMTVACSNAAGGGSGSGDEKDKGKDTEQGIEDDGKDDDKPAVESGEAPEIIEDDDYVGIKIKITTEIPKDTAVREIYVNGKQAGGNGFDTKDDGSISISKYVTATEWGYPFVTAGKKYEVFVKYLDKDYHGLKQTEKITITAKKGLGELKCPNAENKIEKNVLKFPKGSPRVYYGDNISVADYPNLADNSKPGYVLNIYGADWSYQTWNWLGEGKDFEYDQNFNFAKHLKEDADLSKEYMFNVVCSFTDKDYGDYTYFIADTLENKFIIDQDYLPKDSIDITQYFPSIEDLKGKVLQETPSKSQYIEFSSAVDSEGKLPGTLHTYSEGKQSWKDITILYKDGTITNNGKGFSLISDGPGLYCALYSGIRVDGEGRYGTFQFEGDAPLTLSENGTYSVSGKEGGTYTFEDGFINFKDGLLNAHIAIYDGKTIHLILYFFMTIDELPNPLPNPINSSTAVDEVGAPYAKMSEVTPTNSDLSGKIFHFSTTTKAGPRDLFFQFESEGNDPYSPLNVTMYPYGIINSNGEYAGPYGQNAYYYQKGLLSPSTSASGAEASAYQIFRVNKKYYVSPNGSSFKRIENTGNGLYCSFYIQGATLTLSKEGKYTFKNNNETQPTTGKYTNTNGVITLEDMGNLELMYDGDSLYLLIDFIQAASLPTASNSGSENGEGSDYTYLSGTYTAIVEYPGENNTVETSNDTLILDMKKKTFIHQKEMKGDVEGSSKYLYYKGDVTINNDNELNTTNLLFACTHEAESNSQEIPEENSSLWKNDPSYILAEFTDTTITFLYGYEDSEDESSPTTYPINITFNKNQ